MKLKDFKYFFLFFCLQLLNGQNVLYGVITDSLSNNSLENVQIKNLNNDILTITNTNGNYSYPTLLDTLDISISKDGYQTVIKKINFNKNKFPYHIKLSLLNKQLKEVEVIEHKDEVFDQNYLTDVSNNSIYSGKKSELILANQKSGTSSNNARYMYNQTVSLNIYQTDDAGLQLHIGGRGLDPSRSSNFNIRQNGYDISADPLGYPESYYIPPFESLQDIQLIRGAASLQYGTQFGGHINFNIKKPNLNTKAEFVLRENIGSHNLYTNFLSLSGSIRKLSYYSFLNTKKGDGFRDNSDFNSINMYSYIGCQLSDKINVSFELTYLDYLAHQSGGLTDLMFYEDILQSNRTRNWFKVNWLLYNIQAVYTLSHKTNYSINTFILDASRNAIGFRTNRVDQIDSFEERDLIKSKFNNIGFEGKLLHEYQFLNKKMVFLFGSKFYSGNNVTRQGPGSSGVDANFNLQSNIYPNYENQSRYINPNRNYSIFSEHIIYINNNMSLTPGFRLEYIQTDTEGYYKDINTDGAGNVILNNIIFTEDTRKRSFSLFGLGYSFKMFNWCELYSNISQNYRAVTFADINIINPSFIINPNIKDENGYTADFGIRGNYRDFIYYDISFFHLMYNDRIGFIQRPYSDGSVKNEKGNVGNAKITGQELLVNFNLKKVFLLPSKFRFNYFVNISNIESRYFDSLENGITGNQVEFVPKINFKTGVQLGLRNLRTELQYTFLSSQFTDATNSIESDLSGLIGEIPSYNILDYSFSYLLNRCKIELGVNNLLNKEYFTNRATGYPGPGIIPSPKRNMYLTVEFKL